MDVHMKPYGEPFLQEHPDVEIMNILDESLLADTVSAGYVPASVSARLLNYVQGAERAGADLLLLTCTSVDAAMKYVRHFSDLRTICISEPMVQQALDLGRHIGIVGTVPTSPASIIRPLEEAAAERGMALEIHSAVAHGAFEALMSGDSAAHDMRISDALMKLAQEHELDVICFAQASMSASKHADPGIPVLKLGKSAFDLAGKILDEMD